VHSFNELDGSCYPGVPMYPCIMMHLDDCCVICRDYSPCILVSYPANLLELMQSDPQSQDGFILVMVGRAYLH
jgi:hypothetical protein